MKWRFEYMPGFWVFGVVITKTSPGNRWVFALQLPMLAIFFRDETERD
jgi:hypothetical protein